MKEVDLELTGYVLGEDHRNVTAVASHDLSVTAMEEVFDQGAKMVVCPACSKKFSPLIPTCPECGLQFG